MEIENDIDADEDGVLLSPTPDVGMLVAMHAKELDIAIVTAKRFPRSIGKFEREVALAVADEEAAQECIYVLPRAGKSLQGPSIRFAEIVASAWGNSEFAARVADESETFITAQAVFKDLEKNTRFVFEVPRRITDRNGKRFTADMIAVTANAAMAIALRNAILKGIPKAYWGPYYAKCVASIAGTFETLDRRRATALEQFKKLGVSEALVLALLQRDSVRDIEPEDMIVLRGTLQAIRDGDSTVNRIFGALDAELSTSKKADVSGALKKGKEAASEKPKDEPADQGKAAAKKGKAAKPAPDNPVEKPAADDKPAGKAQDADEPSGGSDGPADAEDAPGEADSGESAADSTEAEDARPAAEPDLTPYMGVLDQKWAATSDSALRRAAREFALCESAEAVAATHRRLSPDFEAETPPVENAFAQLHRIAVKQFAGAASKL